MSRSKSHYLEAMGIQRWALRPEWRAAAQRLDRGPAQPSSPAPAAAPAAGSVPDAALDWEALELRVAACVRCELHTTRARTVFGSGSRQAGWMIIGEGPGAEEDRQGVPFVGRAGKLLDNMLRAIGLQREAVYITNVVKCRPPGNRDPRPEEIAACRPYLERQIELLEPRILLAVGRIAAQTLLDTQAPLGRLRGKLHDYGPRHIPLVVTYHPAYLLRSPAQKARAWDDLRLAREAMETRQ